MEVDSSRFQSEIGVMAGSWNILQFDSGIDAINGKNIGERKDVCLENFPTTDSNRSY